MLEYLNLWTVWLIVYDGRKLPPIPRFNFVWLRGASHFWFSEIVGILTQLAAPPTKLEFEKLRLPLWWDNNWKHYVPPKLDTAHLQHLLEHCIPKMILTSAMFKLSMKLWSNSKTNTISILLYVCCGKCYKRAGCMIKMVSAANNEKWTQFWSEVLGQDIVDW